MKNEHTPGPWKRGHNVSHEPTITAADMTRHPVPNGSFIIAQTFGPDKHDNAQLIAAAPELLTALESMRELMVRDFAAPNAALALLKQWDSLAGQVDSAIAKARGD